MLCIQSMQTIAAYIHPTFLVTNSKYPVLGKITLSAYGENFSQLRLFSKCKLLLSIGLTGRLTIDNECGERGIKRM